MKKPLVFLVTALLLVGLSQKAQSQYYLTPHLGPASPTSPAKLGVNIGLQLSRPVFDKGLGLFAGFEVTDHGDRSYLGDYYKFLNLSLSAGMKYTLHATNNFALFTNTGLLLNYLIRTDVTYFSITGKIDSPLKMGLKIGVGLLFFQKFSISANYLGPQKYNMTGEWIINDSMYTIDLGERSIGILTIALGYKIKL